MKAIDIGYIVELWKYVLDHACFKKKMLLSISARDVDFFSTAPENIYDVTCVTRLLAEACIDGIAQYCSISIAKALEIMQFYTKQLISFC